MLARCTSRIYDKPWPFLLLWLLLVIASISILISGLRVDVSLEQLQKPSSESYQAFQQNTAIFGTDESLMLLITAPQIWNEDTLERLAALQRQIGLNLPNVSSISSIINIPLIQSTKNRVVVSTAFDPWPENEKEFEQRLTLIESNAPGAEAIRAAVSKDLKSTLLIISLDQDFDGKQTKSSQSRTEKYAQTSTALNKIVAEHQNNEFQIKITGQARLLSQVHDALLTDIYLLPFAALAISILTLLLLFRRKTGVILPGLVIILPISATLALMAVTNSSVQIPTGMLPPSLVVVSVAFSVHILTTFYSRYTPIQGSSDQQSKRHALEKTIELKARSLTMSMVSTVIALLSFGLSDVVPVANIGLFGAFGIWVSYLSLLLLTPIYIRLVPMSPLEAKRKNVGGVFEKPISTLLSSGYRTSTRYPKSVSLLAVLLLIISTILASRIEFSHKPSEWLPHSWDTYKISQEINRQFNSMISIELLFDSQAEGGIYTPAFVSYLGKIHQEINTVPHELLPVGMSASLHSYLLQLQRMMDQDNSSADLSPNKVARYFSVLRLVAQDVLGKLSDKSGRFTRLVLRVPTLDGKSYQKGIEELRSIIEKHQHESIKIRLAGQASMITATYEALSDSATLSYTLSFVVILLLMIVHMKSVSAGLVIMIPNLLPIMLVLAMMELTNTPLDFLNILVVTLSIGLVVDDTIHFSGHFRQHYIQNGDPTKSVKLSINDTGRAMIVTTLVLTLGWQMLQISQFQQLGLFGLLTSVIMVLGLISDLLIAPALMLLLYKPSANTDNFVKN